MLVPGTCLTSVVVRRRGFRQSCTVVDTVSEDLPPPLVGQLCLFSFAPFHLLAICAHDGKCSCPIIHSGLKGSWQQNANTVLFSFFFMPMCEDVILCDCRVASKKMLP